MQRRILTFGKYSFKEFVNIPDNNYKYINVDTIEDLFVDGKTYNITGLLKNMPSKIYVGLIGSKNITIENEPELSEVHLLGDNTEYTGTITVPDNITDIYFEEKSTIASIKHNGLLQLQIHNNGDTKDNDEGEEEQAVDNNPEDNPTEEEPIRQSE